MTPDEVRQRLEEAGRTLMMLPMPRNGRPAGYLSNWPATVQTYAEWFAAQVLADEDNKLEQLAGRNNVRILPQQRQIDHMQEAVEWVYTYVGNPAFRKIVFARMLVHPISGRNVVSYRKLGREMDIDHHTVKSWHDQAVGYIASGLAKKASPRSPIYAIQSIS